MKTTNLLCQIFLAIAGATFPAFKTQALQPTSRVAAATNTAPAQVTPASNQPTKAVTAAVQETNAGQMHFNIALSHSTYSQSAPVPLLLKVDLASTDAVPTNRPARYIVLVLDRSASMADEEKFPYMMESARAVIENLTEQDVISLVAFNERVLVLSPAGRVVNKPFLFHRLQEIPPQGYADLSAALLEGFAQVTNSVAEDRSRQILVLTDGQANRGVTSMASLRNMAEKARARGVTVSTLGYGTNRNEKLLTEIASAGGGRYVYVRSLEQIPNAFTENLGGLLDIVAQNARLDITIEQGTITKVFGQLWEGPAPSFQMNLGELRAAERGGMLLALNPTNHASGAVVRATAKLTFDAPQTAERLERSVSAQAMFASDGGKKTDQNDEVVIYGGVVNALEAATEGAEGFDRQRYQQALSGFGQWYGRAREFALKTRNQDLLNQTFMLKHLLADMEAAERAGRMHEHTEARQKLQKEIDYRRYLLFHHREGEQH